ncbi:hypothetical protein [Rhodococcus sp. NPDC058521]|uniref:hypothetical protein n=1 Tax=Rhodococcus sp. NPDC058521 TaxID=3346536 RepID=UPI0036579CF7
MAREIAGAVLAAVTAVQSESASHADEAFEELEALPFEQVVSVQSGIVRELLEMAHPDGLVGEDVQEVLQRCIRSTAAWCARLDVQVLVEVLTGALGVADVDANPQVAEPGAYVAAATVVIVDLLRAVRVPAVEVIRRSVGEIARAETMEIP